MSRSYRKVNYLLRLKKQIERKMIIETVQRLGPSILDISKYRYFGLGSVYFADFILFHKYLNIKNMTSIDYNKGDEVRFRFNLPFDFISFEISSTTEYMRNNLDWKESLFIWLDYDDPLALRMVEDAVYVASMAKPMDIFLATIKAEVPKNPDSFKKEFGPYIPEKIAAKGFSKEGFPKLLHSIMNASVLEGLTRRLENDDTGFLQLFNLVYRDTSKMYTFGGVFCDDDAAVEIKANLNGLKEYVSYDDGILDIDCPILTLKEKIHLDSLMEHGGICKADTDEVGLSSSDIEAYGRYYKYYPQFFESLY